MRCVIFVDEEAPRGGDPKAVLKTRSAAIDAVEWKCNCVMADSIDTLGTLSGKHNRSMDGAMDGDLPVATCFC